MFLDLIFVGPGQKTSLDGDRPVYGNLDSRENCLQGNHDRDPAHLGVSNSRVLFSDVSKGTPDGQKDALSRPPTIVAASSSFFQGTLLVLV